MTARRFGARKRPEEKTEHRKTSKPPSWTTYRPDDGGNPRNNRNTGGRTSHGGRQTVGGRKGRFTPQIGRSGHR